MRQIVKDYCAIGNTTQRELAASAGVSAQFVNDVIRGRRDVSDTLAREFGYRRVVRFERINDDV